MRTVFCADTPLTAPQSSPRWQYALLAEEIEADGFQCESYGIAISDLQSGTQTAVRHITVNHTEALNLLERLARLSVSPITLRDVIEDYWGE